MDINKLGVNSSLNYRIPKKHERTIDDITARMLTYLDTHDVDKLDALDILGLLWLERMTVEQNRTPRTMAERTYMRQVGEKLDKEFPDVAYGNKLDLNWAYKKEAIMRMKGALLALHFGQLKAAHIKQINEKMGDGGD